MDRFDVIVCAGDPKIRDMIYSDVWTPGHIEITPAELKRARHFCRAFPVDGVLNSWT
jgi:hypothetical protein